MKTLDILVCALATVLALPSQEIKPRNVVVPAGRPQGRIIQGRYAIDGQIPYQVGLLLQDNNSTLSWCGGSLLNNKWVLTAAHCIADTIKASILVGNNDHQSGEYKHHVTSASYVIHKDYDPLTQENDIALIKIPFTKYSKRIRPVKLPAIDQPYSDYNGKKVIASGWGLVGNSPRDTTHKLKWATLAVIPNGSCKRSFLPNSTICTSTIRGTNICNGDSGGPLVLEVSKIQVGVTSFGERNCLKDVPAVFTRITSYLKWINETTGISYYKYSN